MQIGSASMSALRVGILISATTLIASCENSAGSETMTTVGRELNSVLPTVAASDSDQTKRENALFRTVFFTIWPEYRP